MFLRLITNDFPDRPGNSGAGQPRSGGHQHILGRRAALHLLRVAPGDGTPELRNPRGAGWLPPVPRKDIFMRTNITV
jgi:hypothetical protein